MTMIANIDSLITFLQEEFIRDGFQQLMNNANGRSIGIPIRVSSKYQSCYSYREKSNRHASHNSNGHEDSQDSLILASYPVCARTATRDSRAPTRSSISSERREKILSNLQGFNDSAVQIAHPR
jgi:molybdenum cofactor sulfurtransferase